MTTTVSNSFALREFNPLVPTQYAMDASIGEEFVGIEIEIENARHIGRLPSDIWSVTDDGSLRNNGVECITVPVDARYVPSILTDLYTKNLHSECCFSPRTSVHVHLNMRDMTLEKVKDFVVLYVLVEKCFYRVAGRGRMKNIYCVPIAETSLLEHFYHSKFPIEWEKYTGLNILPLYELGTVEFRHMHGTRDIGKLTMWLQMITRLKAYAKSVVNMHEFVASLDMRDRHSLLADIFGPDLANHKLILASDLQENILEAKRAMCRSKTNLSSIAIILESSSPFMRIS